ncbi:metallophosphoesterase [candidate division KSB1 bacterium]|nr:metallophosphoesterase family protein [candidate division KSB1 bacterium]RQW00971.1 MAG: metallophosphoesterase [candidate division KSB1 bacterium]
MATLTIGIISDTHGVLPNEVMDIFSDVDQIIHAGDIGNEDILIELATLAPVVAVYGNMDGFRIRQKTRERVDFSLYGFDFIISHIPGPFTADDKPTIRINGHTHEPKIIEMNGSFYINPGSASKPPGKAKRSVAKLILVKAGEARVDIIYF